MNNTTNNELHQLTLFEDQSPIVHAHLNKSDRTPLECLLEKMYDPSKYQTRGEYVNAVLKSFSQQQVRQCIWTQEMINMQAGQAIVEDVANVALNIFDKNCSLAYTKEQLRRSWVLGTMSAAATATELNSGTYGECDLPRGLESDKLIQLISNLSGIAEIRALKDQMENVQTSRLLELAYKIKTVSPEYYGDFLMLLGTTDILFTMSDIIGKLNIAAQSIRPAQLGSSSNVQNVTVVSDITTQQQNPSVLGTVQHMNSLLETFAMSTPNFAQNIDAWRNAIYQFPVEAVMDIINVMRSDDLSVKDTAAATITLQLTDTLGFTPDTYAYIPYYQSLMMFAYYQVLPRNCNIITDDQKLQVLSLFNAMTGIAIPQRVPSGIPTQHDVLSYDLRHHTRYATVWYATASNDIQLKTFAVERFTPNPATGVGRLNIEHIISSAKATDPNITSITQPIVVSIIQSTGYIVNNDSFVNMLADSIATIVNEYCRMGA